MIRLSYPDTCISCGKIIPEGYGLTCYGCSNKFRSYTSNIYADIRNKLIDFEHCNDKETTDPTPIGF